MRDMVSDVLTTIRDRYDEPLGLDDLARVAYVSKFHLLRTFRRQTGVTPGRFLAAVRLQEAKRMLHGTSLNVADIATQVGYCSTGSFTRRFTDAVGLAPIQYRRMSRGEDFAPVQAPARRRDGGSVVRGVVRTAFPTASPIFVGAFSGRILQGEPQASTLLEGPGPFEITGVPCGRWYFHAAALPHPGGPATPDAALLSGCVGPVTRADGLTKRLSTELELCPPEWTDPPILFALLGLSPATGASRLDDPCRGEPLPVGPGRPPGGGAGQCPPAARGGRPPFGPPWSPGRPEPAPASRGHRS